MYRLDRFKRVKDNIKYIMPFGRILSVVHRKQEVGLLLNKDGSLQATWRYRGPDLDSAVIEQLANLTAQLNAMFASMSTGWVMYFEAQRRASTEYSEQVFFPDEISKAIDLERKNLFSDGQHFESEYYATLSWMPPSETEERMKAMVVEGREQKKLTEEDAVFSFFEVVDKVFDTFNVWSIPSFWLSPDELLTYIHSTVSENPRPLRVPNKSLLVDRYLFDTPLYGGLEPRLGNKHLRVICPIVFRTDTYFGLFNALNRLDFEYRWFTRYFCLSKQDAIDALGTVKRGWNGKVKSIRTMIKELFFNSGGESGDINENALRKFDEVKDAISATEGDTTSYGYYSTAVIVTDEDLERCEAKAHAVRQLFVNLGYKAVIEDLNAVDAWMGSIPGAVSHNIRRPIVSCGNLVHMMPISGIWAGPNWNNTLKGPVLLYTQTDGNTPFRLSLHVGDVGHTLLVGPTGAGKSVHLNLIAAQFRKYKNAKVFIFDKGASSRILTEGVGGNFYDLGNENNGLSFQPLAHVDDEKERQWAQEWLCDFIRQENVEITPDIKKLIWASLCTIATMPEKLRTMSSFINNLQSENLKTAYRQLSIEGPYGKIFDSDKDTLSFSSWQSFEMEKLMGTKAIVTPTLMYIFHRIEQRLAGDPTIIILDECWVFFDNPLFAEKIREWLKVLRKSNASVIFATQSLTDIAESPIFSTILESCMSRIFLPNDKAIEENNRKLYNSFGLNKRQIEIITAALPKRQYYYVSPLGCRLYDLGLEHCPLTLAYLAVNKADQKQCQQILDEFGHENFNEHWLSYRQVELPKEDVGEAAVL